jgi:3-oxoacyl-[acyl-carrier-protein] synthase II
MRLGGVGLLSGWGEGVAALPVDAARAAGGRRVLPVVTPGLGGERFRRATRECRLGVAAVQALLREAGLEPAAIRGGATGLVYVSAAAYAASNRAFIDAAGSGGGGALHFPYTAPSAVPAEVAIEFGLTGAYVILIGGAATTIDALWQAERLLVAGAAERMLVLAVETFAECADLYARARWAVGAPLVEAAACALLEPGPPALTAAPAAQASSLEAAVRRRAGETFACGPLIALALAAAAGEEPWSLTGLWRGRRTALAVAPPAEGQ